MDSVEESGFILEPLSLQSFDGKLDVVAGKVYTLGRSKSCDFVIKDGRISRRQCQLFVDPHTQDLVMFHGVSEHENVAGIAQKRKRSILAASCSVSSTITVNNEKILAGEFTVLQPGCRVLLVVSVRNLPEIGFLVQLMKLAQRCSLKEISVNFLGSPLDLSCKGNIKRLKVSVEKLIHEGRQLRNEIHAQSLTVERKVQHESVVMDAGIDASRQIEENSSQKAFKTAEADAGDLTESRDEELQTKTEVPSGIQDVCEVMKNETDLASKQQPKNLQTKRNGSSGLCCNLLEDKQPTKTQVSLMDLFDPVDELREVFLATFTYDILWFVSSANLPKTIPITVACHDTERSWSTSVNDRMHHPYPDWPQLKIVYPPFPVLRRTDDKSRMRGVGCHHPKLILLKRCDSLRVVITSANLTYRQWFQVSNTLWWQDFPLQQNRDFKSLFSVKPSDSKTTTGDFPAQLAPFVSSLVKDVPTEAHWAIDIVNYDFSRAAVSLVASVPGFHETPLQRPQDPSLLKQYLGTLVSSVVGISYNYYPRADPNGARLRKLAAIVGTLARDPEGMIPVTIRRANLQADPNAVAVFAVSSPKLLDHFTGDPEVHIGFLPKRAAQWLAALWDGGFCNFTARLWPKQVLAVAAGQNKSTVELVLHVLEGPSFVELPEKLLTQEQLSAMANLLRHIQRTYGLWRMEDILSTHKWPDAAETDFVYCSSSVGTSLSSRFSAAFSAASGRKATLEDDYESDPEWGCWTDQHEKLKPSIKILFPTINRVKTSKCGPSSYRGLLHFVEKTWDRIKSTGVLYDAVPYPENRTGVPMHVKVGCRRFQSSQRAFGWVYSGSHNFSAAAWGKCVNKSSNEDELGRKSSKRLHICNYELGIVFMDPPGKSAAKHGGIDELCLPFELPAPKYTPSDRPATGKAIFDLVQKIGEEERSIINEFPELDSEILSEIDLEAQDPEEDDDATSSAYVEQLIPQYQTITRD